MELKNRELSWLSFNDRVLQEALDDTVPLIERMRFLGIYSNNLDEFFRVRVAFIGRMISLGKTEVLGFDGSPSDLFEEIRNVVMHQQKKLQVAYNKILKEFDQDLTEKLQENMKNSKIKIHLDVEIKEITKLDKKNLLKELKNQFLKEKFLGGSNPFKCFTKKSHFLLII